MNNSIINQLQNLIDHKNYQPKTYNKHETDDLVCAERLSDDIDYYFKESFRIGLQIGFECKE